MDVKDLPKWLEIQQDYSDTLVVGNGGSMAICDSFGYKNLYDYGCNQNLVNASTQQIFNYLSSDSKDFERVLYRLWQLEKVNGILEIQDQDKKIDNTISTVRKALLETVRGVHPRYESLDYSKLLHVGQFAGRYSTVISLNYDLTLHWALAAAKKMELLDHSDGFTNVSKRSAKASPNQAVKQYHFDENRFNGSNIQTRVLYPHGNLALYKNRRNTESRLVGKSDRLLNALTGYWNNSGIPLFVSEGTTEDKILKIQQSKYLKAVYSEYLPKSKIDITIVGWGMGKQDAHILEKLTKSGCQKYAVGVHTAKRTPKTIQNEINRFTEALEPYINMNSVTFFDSSSPGCWANEERI